MSSPFTAAAASPPSLLESLLLVSSSSFDLGRKILILGMSAESAEAEPLLCGVKVESMSPTRAEFEWRRRFFADEEDDATEEEDLL